MTLIKKKSLIVAAISGIVISWVLVLTLVGYVIYIEFKEEESRSGYEVLLGKISARFYIKNLEISGLNAEIEAEGPLKGYAVLKGAIKNIGPRNVADLVVKVKFLDRDCSILYEVIFRPQEPSLGASVLTNVSIPYLAGHSKAAMKSQESISFKKILADCPDGIRSALAQKDRGFARKTGRWSGRLDFELVSADFAQ